VIAISNCQFSIFNFLSMRVTAEIGICRGHAVVVGAAEISAGEAASLSKYLISSRFCGKVELVA